MHARKWMGIVAGLGLVAGLALPTSASVMFEFTSNATVAAPTNSPGHASGSIPAGETTWNVTGGTAVAAGAVKNGDGSVATNVALTFGTAPASSTLVTFGTPTLSNGVGGGASTGDYGTGSAGRGIVFFNTPSAKLGVRIDGLPVGSYNVFVTGRNTQNTTGTAMAETFFYATAPLGATLDVSSVASVTPSNGEAVSNASANTTWVQGDQYQVFSATTTATNSSLYVVAGSANTTDNRPFLGSIEIVATPEPSALALGGFIFVGLLARRRAGGIRGF